MKGRQGGNRVMIIKQYQKPFVPKYANYEMCKGCLYYYGEINWCMYGEEGVSDDLEKKCNKEK